MNDVSKFDYLRGRPFLVVDAIVRPAAGVRTENRGWATEANNLSVVDRPSVVFRISDKILRQAEVIIDLRNDTVIKNRLCRAAEPVTDATMLRRCKERYHSHIGAYV